MINVTAITSYGKPIPLSLPELDTVDIIYAMGGTLLIKKIHDYVPPIDCCQLGCDEFAEFLALFYSSQHEDLDIISCLCSVHKDVLISLGELDIPAYWFH